ncbi:hypothetical protein A3E04_03090 [Candidatus Kuenenbacteria bacterium RIFCSPHIGHO2_12_FULL_42_14]|uniref:Glycerophosphoryl diester phosphodiesterase membrane domain-containing protein n=1 Tax=Candidatus Kuenenbacteria bacterium RIFCSPHIGHO2_12_FULL_42_14 TaxID=1798563 RepID=A0A1F6GQF2_9BACT|nr:MAG: hypothetical protein A3E04_03090 [Candidatus Kuenenbacteria bacterium RIFCSPHIGHO2_12_FULL_42_14]
MEPIYRPILKKAWLITWRFKYLWFFGLFAALLGSGGLYNFDLSVDKASDQGTWLLKLKEFFSGNLFADLGAGAAGTGSFNVWLMVLLVVVAVLGIFLFWLSVVSQGALIYGAREANQGRILFFSEAFNKGRKKFFSLFVLNVVMALVALLILAVTTLPFLLLVFKPELASTAASLFVAISFIILAPLGFILSFVVRYGLIFVVNKDRSIWAAISEARNMFKKNWLPSLEMAILIWLIYIVLGLVLGLLTKYIILPVIVYIFALFVNTYAGSELLVQALVTFGLIVYLAISLLIAAAVSVFETSSWVLLFERLNNDEVESKVVRLVSAALAGNREPDKLLPKPEGQPELLTGQPRKVTVKKIIKKKALKDGEATE